MLLCVRGTGVIANVNEPFGLDVPVHLKGGVVIEVA